MSGRGGDRQRDPFCVQAQAERIGERTVRSGALALGAEIASSFLRIGSTAILARLLMPDDFGLVAMVTAFTSFAERFKDMGLADATIQSREISHPQVSALFWVNALISVGIALLLVSASSSIAWFYGEPRLTAVSMVLASTFLCSGFAIQHRAILNRQLRFGSLAAIQVGSVSISVLIAIAMAYYGFGYWALVAREVSRVLLDAAGTWMACPWRPGLARREAGMSGFLTFGGNVTGFNLVHFFSRSLDKIILGKLFGPYWVGLYANAFQLVSLPVNHIQSPTNAVALPALSALQEATPRFKDYYEKMVQLLTFLTMPIVVFVAIFADLVIGILLGPKWMNALQIFQILAVGLFVEPLSHSVGPAMVAMGKTREYLRLGLINATLLIVCLAVGSGYGVLGMAVGYSVSAYLTTMTSLSYGLAKIPVSVGQVLQKVIRCCGISLLTAVVLLCARVAAGWDVAAPWILPYLVLWVATYVCLWMLVPGGKDLLRDYWLLAKRAIASA